VIPVICSAVPNRYLHDGVCRLVNQSHKVTIHHGIINEYIKSIYDRSDINELQTQR
jgi:hypothetical protein